MVFKNIKSKYFKLDNSAISKSNIVFENCEIESLIISINVKYNINTLQSQIGKIVFQNKNPKNFISSDSKIYFSSTTDVMSNIECSLEQYLKNKKRIDKNCREGMILVNSDVTLWNDDVNPKFMIKVIGQDLNISLKSSEHLGLMSLISHEKNNFSFQGNQIYFEGDCSNFTGSIHSLLLKTNNLNINPKFHNVITYLELDNQDVVFSSNTLKNIKELVINNCEIDILITNVEMLKITNSIIKKIHLKNHKVDFFSIDQDSLEAIREIRFNIINNYSVPTTTSNKFIFNLIKDSKINYLESNKMSENL